MTALRVLHMIPTLGGGGAERQITYLAKGLVEHGVDVHVASLRGGPNLERLRSSGATTHTLNRSGHYTPALPIAAIRLIRRLEPDVMQSWLLQMDLIGGVAALATRTPWLVSERSSPANYPPQLRYAMRTALGRWSSAIVANSASGLEVWKNARVKKFVVPNAVPFDEIASAMPFEGVSADRRLVLFAGRFEKEKNLRNLIAALGKVVARDGVEAMLCGSGPMERDVRRWIAETEAPERIQLQGFSASLPALMKRADVCVAVSAWEGHPNVVLEAIACGTPLVVSDIPAHRAFLDESRAAIVPGGDPEAIAAAIQHTLDDRVAARERAVAALRVAEQWTIERVAAQYIAIYEELLGRRAA